VTAPAGAPQAPAAPSGVSSRAEVLSNRPAGAYAHLVLHAPEAARAALPGHFAACGTGDTGMLLRRSFSLHAADPVAGTLEVVVAASGPGTRAIAAARPGDRIATTAPLGRPFPLPDGPVPAVLVGGGYGAAPLAWLARVLRERGSRVDAVVGAATRERLLGTAAVDLPTALDDPAAPLADSVTVTTDDGSAGTAGRVTDVLPEVLAAATQQAAAAPVVYACGPMAMLRAVHGVAARAGATSWLAVEESMACGIGVCMTCVLPVVGADGATRMVRTCTEGPTFAGSALRWDAIGPRGARVPDDAVGAPAGAGGHR
jgi:dihydroorotate dehydrogenase electron transfer subunit